MNQTNNRIREEWEEDFDEMFCNKEWTVYEGIPQIKHEATKKALKSFIAELLKSQEHKLRDELVESVASAIYDQMSYIENGVKPKWVVNGNSLKQDEARKLARLSLIKEE